ncbi:hypothetical protein AHAS_Ahas13G0365200 [Arachis hypogaea]
MMTWIRELDPPRWLQHCNDRRRYDHMTTNLSDCINSVHKDTHNLPVCAIVNFTYHHLNVLLVNKGRGAQAHIGCEERNLLCH